MSSDLRSVPNLTMMFSLQYITNITESQPKPPSTQYTFEPYSQQTTLQIQYK